MSQFTNELCGIAAEIANGTYTRKDVKNKLDTLERAYPEETYMVYPVARKEKPWNLAYKRFQENKQAMLNLLAEKVIEFINENFDVLRFNWPEAKKIQDASELSTVLMPTSLLFKQDGTTLLLFECAWDTDAGFAVQIYPDWEMGRQDLFL